MRAIMGASVCFYIELCVQSAAEYVAGGGGSGGGRRG